MQHTDYVTEVNSDWDHVNEAEWDALLAQQSAPSPFMSWAYLKAMHDTGCASVDTGWALRLVTLRQQGELMAACPVYLKNHSYGEYVFDWAWAQAYERHGLDYYPKAVIAVPFTPVPGSRLLARSDEWRPMLLAAALQEVQRHGASSLHLLLGSEQDLACAAQLGLMRRDGVQFHWQNAGYPDFESFLRSLTHSKRKKIRQERRRVSDAGISFAWIDDPGITDELWRFFKIGRAHV